ncbi:MAG: hypothetical protein JSR33_10520 [Proteobacteria bacterium]|nr:hypothetical protein [Pseudomonadota bacterium]
MIKISKSILLLTLLAFYLPAAAVCHNGMPADGAVTAKGIEVRQGFYLDPLLPIANRAVDTKSLVRMTFPKYYLFLATIGDYSADVSRLGEKISIGQTDFYKQETSDAGMCHQYNYFTYFLPKEHHIDAFIFLVTSNCFAKHPSVDTSEFENVLACVTTATPTK